MQLITSEIAKAKILSFFKCKNQPFTAYEEEEGFASGRARWRRNQEQPRPPAAEGLSRSYHQVSQYII
jgi:hypothetical protein